MPIDGSKALVHQLIEEMNRGNLDVIDEVYAADCVVHLLWPHPFNPSTLQESMQSTIADMKQLAAAARAAFPDGQYSIDEMVAEEDRVIFRTTFHGTQTGEHFGVAPTGKQMWYVRYSTVRVAEGMIAEEELCTRALDLMISL